MPEPLSDYPTIEQLEDYFGHDRFAEHVGCKIVEGYVGHGVAELVIENHHRNALGIVMGGAVFTLADFALALASNIGAGPAVSINSSIDYYSASQGTKLIATCNVDKAGRRLGFYTTDVTDDEGKRIARMTTTVFRDAS